MGKSILAVYYTQSGQLRHILHSFTQPLIAAGHNVEFLEIKPLHPYPFPWPTPAFFDTVPESVNGVPTVLEPWQTLQPKYDVVILGWQPWNLSPSIPFNSLMQDERFKALIKDTPVITISGCRNMWIQAQEKNKKSIQAAGARLVGNVVLIDKHWNHVSYVTILHWMGTGRKDRKWGIFPKPGVSDRDIKGAARFGETVRKHLEAHTWDALQPALAEQKAVPIKYVPMFIERKAEKIFQKWVHFIYKYPHKRKQILVAYRYYLTVALLVVSPIILLVDLIFFRPFLQKKINKQIQYYSSVEIN